MKKTVITLFVVTSLLYACGGGAGSDTGSGTTAKKDITQNPAYIAGLDLVSKSGCPTCHKPNEASTGPSYKNIANKYPNNVETYETLSLKIIKGGYGVWGQIPMIPHPDVTQETATVMLKYILLLKD